MTKRMQKISVMPLNSVKPLKNNMKKLWINYF